MFFGVDCFNNEEVFENIVVSKHYYQMEVSNGKFDEVYITKKSDNVENVKPTTWDLGNTIFSCDYDNTIKAGNIYGDVNIGYIKIKRKRVGDYKWEDLKILPYEENKIRYSYDDNFVEALESYEYIVQPIGTNGALGNLQSQSIEIADFDGVWLVSEDEIYHMFYNLDVGNYPHIIPSSSIETLGGIYPMVMTNGLNKYRKGSISCLILSDNTINSYGVIDKKAEKIFRQNIMNFLTNKRPKVFKDSSGEYMVISIIGEPTLIPKNNMNRQVYDVNFNFIEVGNKELLTLHHAGIIG